MNNQMFNINGTERKLLKKALEFVFMIDDYYKPKAWKIDNKKGLVLFWHEEKGATPFEKPLSVAELTSFAWDFIHSEEAQVIEPSDWENDLEAEPCGFDGHTKLGWRVYKERWGRIQKGDSEYESYDYSFVAIKPCYAWYGK